VWLCKEFDSELRTKRSESSNLQRQPSKDSDIRLEFGKELSIGLISRVSDWLMKDFKRRIRVTFLGLGGHDTKLLTLLYHRILALKSTITSNPKN
jgi:hypothetical protein